MSDCVFCKIANKEIEAKIIYKNKSAIAFLDINPHAPAHTVVIPKNHFENILDLNDDNILQLFSALKETAALLKKTINPDGFTIGINHGRVAGQAINHLHIHIMPRFLNDGGGSIHSVVLNKPKESIEEIYNKIKNYGN
ncbi:MAG: HIT family protein [Candidatus Parcubacteria bacterium]|nr:MAG: HIT family protein [Candidatus Parcubacteria bacterium]